MKEPIDLQEILLDDQIIQTITSVIKYSPANNSMSATPNQAQNIENEVLTLLQVFA